MSGGQHFPVDRIHFPDHHGEEDAFEEAGDDEIPSGWEFDNVELTTVGVDIGSSTSHLLFSRLHMQRLAQSLSSRFVVVSRDTLHRSPILLTPYAQGNRIDVMALRAFVESCYREAGLTAEQVDTGAVILTGVALERTNARAVAEVFADEGGRFVCASAGHNLEAMLAAYGSGAVALSRSLPGRRFHIDIGGGTSKLAALEHGEIIATAALAVGGRLLTFDADGRLQRIEWAARAMAENLGLKLCLGERLSPIDRRKLVDRMVELLLDALQGRPTGPLGRRLQLTDPLGEERNVEGLPLTCSGGVAEYIYDREPRVFNDVAADLARAFRSACVQNQVLLEALPGGEGIRATAVGAAQFTVQLSGNTVFVSNPSLLPLRNLPVVRPRLPAGDLTEVVVAAAVARALRRLDLSESTGHAVAISIAWSGEPRHAQLRALAGGVVDGLRAWLDAGQPLVLALEADLGRSVGHILTEELGVVWSVVCIDGVELRELDYVDIGQLVQPANVVPVVVKSLAFAAAGIDAAR